MTRKPSPSSGGSSTSANNDPARSAAPSGTYDSSLILVQSLTKTYSKLRALNDVTFIAQPGRALVLLGANGAGKATIKRTIGLVRPTGGRISVAGLDVLKRGVQAKHHLGLVPDWPYTHHARTPLLVRMRNVPNSETKIGAWLEQFKLTNVHNEFVETGSRCAGCCMPFRRR